MHLLRTSAWWNTGEKSSIVQCLPLKDHLQTLVGGPDAKRGPFKFLPLVRGVLKKNYHKFSSKNWVYMLFYGIEFTCFSMGIFMQKRRGWIFLMGGGAKTVCDDFFFVSDPPYKCLWMVPKCLGPKVYCFRTNKNTQPITEILVKFWAMIYV